MEDIIRLARYISSLNFSSVRNAELACSLPDLGMPVTYLNIDGEEDILDVAELRFLLRDKLRELAPYRINFEVDEWKQKPNTLRIMADVIGPEQHPAPYAVLLVTFQHGKYETEFKRVEHDDYSHSDAMWPFQYPAINDDVVRLIELAKNKSIEWHINLEDIDQTFLREVKSMFVGFGFTCDDGVVLDMKEYPNMDTKEAFHAKRDESRILVMIDRRRSVMQNHRFVVYMK